MEAPTSPILHSTEDVDSSPSAASKITRGKLRQACQREKTQHTRLLLLLYTTITAAQLAVKQLFAEGLINSPIAADLLLHAALLCIRCQTFPIPPQHYRTHSTLF